MKESDIKALGKHFNGLIHSAYQEWLEVSILGDATKMHNIYQRAPFIKIEMNGLVYELDKDTTERDPEKDLNAMWDEPAKLHWGWEDKEFKKPIYKDIVWRFRGTVGDSSVQHLIEEVSTRELAKREGNRERLLAEYKKTGKVRQIQCGSSKFLCDICLSEEVLDPIEAIFKFNEKESMIFRKAVYYNVDHCEQSSRVYNSDHHKESYNEQAKDILWEYVSKNDIPEIEKRLEKIES